MAAAKSDYNEEEVHDIKGMTELYSPDCCLVNSVKEDSDQCFKEKDLDGKREDLLKTYLDFNRNLWTDSVNNESTDQLDETEKIIRDKLEVFQDGVKDYSMKHISEKHCLLYREFEINGIARKVFKKKKKVEIESALTNIIEFPSCYVSPKTTKAKDQQNVKKRTWKEATQDYLDRYYPTDGVFRIPPSLEYEDELKAKGSKKPLVKDVQQLGLDERALEERIPKNIKEKYTDLVKEFFNRRRGVTAENKVLIAFEKWGRDTGQNMFIFGGYKYSDYLNNVDGLGKMTTEQGEFDVLIISQQLGVIFVEVKGSVGAKHFMKESTGDKADPGCDVENGAVEMNGKTEEGIDRRSNVGCTRERRADKLSSKDDHPHESLDKDLSNHFNGGKVSNTTKSRMNGVQGKPTNLESAASGSSCKSQAGDVPSGKDSLRYKETKPGTVQSEIIDGWQQLMKGNFVFREMNRDLSFVKRLSFKALVGLPFLSRSDEIGARICNHHQKHVIYSEDLYQLQDWLEDNHFVDGYNKTAMSRKEFRELVARFVGLGSAVKTETDTIKFTNRKMMCTFLTPQQTAVLHSEQKHALLFGDYGTGKTFVLTRKATSLVSLSDKDQSNSGKKQKVVPPESTNNFVHIVPCADLSNFKSCYGVTFSDQEKGCKKFVEEGKTTNVKIYQSFLEFYRHLTGSPPDRNVVVGIHLVIDAVRRCLPDFAETGTSSKEQANITNGKSPTKRQEENEISPLRHDAPHDYSGREPTGEERHEEKVVHHFFFDEFPVHPLEGGSLEKLRNFFSCYLKDSFLWISVATHSLGVSSQDNPSELLLKELSIEVDEDLLFCYLKDVMRVSGEMYKMIKQIETFIDKGHFEHSNIGHMLKGIKPKLYRIPERKCEILENNALGCECQVKYLASTLRRVLDTVVDKGGTPLPVTIMVYYVMSTPMFTRLRVLLTRVALLLGIELVWNTMQSRYTEENFTAFADGLNREADASETSQNTNGRTIKQSVEALRSSCPTKGVERLQVKNLTETWKIPVADQRTFAGCETPVLIFIDPFGMRHWFKRGKGKGSGYHSLIFTRCTGHFILITWPDDEAEKMWHQHLDEYKAEIKESDATEEYKQGRYKYINSGREVSENCLEMLLDKDLRLIIEMDNKLHHFIA